MVQLLKHKCLPILLYALEVSNIDKRILQSLDFTVNRFFMKLFRTSNIHTEPLKKRDILFLTITLANLNRFL